MRCDGCKEERRSTAETLSAAMPGMVIRLCLSCKNSSIEPRHMLVLAARSGVNIRYWVVNHKYVGRNLTAEEVMP